MPNPSPAVDAAHPIDGLRAASHIPEALAQQLAAEHYGLPATAHRLDSERDQNFRLKTLDGREYVLKIANPSEDRAVTNLQTEALVQLAAVDPDLPVPRIFPALNGANELDIGFDDGSTRVVRLLSFLAGTPFHTVESSTARSGAISANAPHGWRAGFAISGIPAPTTSCSGIFSTPPNCARCSMLSRPTGAIWSTHFLDGFETRVLPVLSGLPKQPLHNDLNPHNIVVDSANSERIAGIIDFGDLTLTARVNDLAITAAYQVADSDDPLAPACELIGAYHAVTPLDPIEFEILFDLIATRMVMTIVISSWRAIRYPGNRDYILRNNPAAWGRLQRIAKLTRAGARQQIQHACHSE